MKLLDGEQLTFQTIDPALGSALSDSAINEKYIKGEIRIVTEQARYPINTVPQLVDNPAYTLSPEYQRRHRWSVQKQSRLIESLIMNVPLPPIFLYEHDYSRYEVMDGLQRLTAIKQFYVDGFPLLGLDYWQELNDRTYSQLPDKIREGIDRRYLSSIILLKETAKSEAEALFLKQLVFERLNSGGERLTDQEARNATYDGPLNRLCIKLSKNRTLCRLWGIPPASDGEIAETEPPSEERVQNASFREMEDVELVLRFFSYRQKQQLHRGGSLKKYLDTYLVHGNKFSPNVLSNLAGVFEATMALLDDVFGERAFWLYRKRGSNWNWLERPTTTAYDSLSGVMSGFLDQAAELRKRKEQIQISIEQFYKDKYSTFEGRNVNPSILLERENAYVQFLENALKQ